MLNNSYLPITNQLLTLASPLPDAQKQLLAEICDALFNDLNRRAQL